jgi:phosphatidylglycerol---prolipoprotein diacylglyceryl transferase
MHPILIHAGAFTIYSYGVLVATGVLLSLWYARVQAPRAGLDPDRVWNLGIYMVLSAIIIAKVWYVLSDLGYYREHPGEIFGWSTLQSGGTFYGGVVGAVGFALIYMWAQKIPALPLFDTYAFALPLGHAIGRVGCFMAGCCYGKPTTLPWGVTFTNEAAERLVGTPLDIPLHPTQLYEATVEFLNFLILIGLGRRQTFRGQIMGTYLLLYGVERGTIEFFRGDPGRTMMFHNSVSLMQLVSVALISTGTVLWWRGLSNRAPLRAPQMSRAR